MSKTVLVLVLSLLVLVMSILGGSRQSASVGQNMPPSSTSVAKVSTASLPTGPLRLEFFKPVLPRHDLWIKSVIPSLILRKAPSASDKLISSLLFDPNQQPCWVRLVDSGGKNLVLNRVYFGTKLAIGNSHKNGHQDKLVELKYPLSFSKNLLESSPPGFFLLI